MSEPKRPVPQPTPADSLPPEIPAYMRSPQPGPLRVTQFAATGVLELAVVYKVTYDFSPGRRCRLADEQIPLYEDAAPHEALEAGGAVSYRSLPEVIGFKTGTDVVVQASAHAPRPTPMMRAAVQIGEHSHAADVIGRRFCELINGEITFTPPQPFEEMPLRYENAYGGRDQRFEEALMKEVERITPPEHMRRAKPALGAIFGANNPLMYPRNRFGKGYILEHRREFIEGRELPGLENPADRLTPDRIVVENPLGWTGQPLPIGFDYLDPLSFPRSAMLGMPPACNLSLNSAPEVTSGLIPSDFCKGNAFAGSPDNIPNLIHPAGSRCASLGLWMPFLRGDEDIVLTGMDPDFPVLPVQLPGERPEFATNGPGLHLDPQLHLVLIDVRNRLMSLIWTGSTPSSHRLLPGQDQELASTLRIQMRKV